jgi:hypothetical protein
VKVATCFIFWQVGRQVNLQVRERVEDSHRHFIQICAYKVQFLQCVFVRINHFEVTVKVKILGDVDEIDVRANVGIATRKRERAPRCSQCAEVAKVEQVRTVVVDVSAGM